MTNRASWPAEMIVACSDFPDLLAKLAHPNLKRWKFIWRGVSDITYRLDPGIVRRVAKLQYEGDPQLVTESDVQSAEAELLEGARRLGYANVPGQASLTDDQLRARLQHQGAATRLLDVTPNALVALWMAVEDGDPERDGALFAFDWSVSTDRERRSVAEVLDKESGTWLLNYDVDLDPRIRAQHGRFLVGRLPKGSDNRALSSLPLEFPKYRIDRIFSDHPERGRYPASPTFAFKLTPALKKEAKVFLRRILDMRPETIYPDIAGYSKAHGA